MIIDFAALEEKVLPQFQGGEQETRARIFADEQNRIMQIRLRPGASIGPHRHSVGSEAVYILHGRGKALLEDGEEALRPGVCHYCPNGRQHSIVNDGAEDLIFFAVVALV